MGKKAKFIFSLEKSSAKQPYHCRIRSCNGRIVFFGENMIAKGSPLKTARSLIEAIKKGEYRIEDFGE